MMELCLGLCERGLHNYCDIPLVTSYKSFVKHCMFCTPVMSCIETLIIQCHCIYLLRSGSGIELPALSDYAESLLQ